MSGLAPMMSIWNSITPPKFTGEVGGWADFSVEWRKHLRLVEDSMGRPLGGDMKIEILKNCLDADNRAILVAKSAQEEGFDQIWSEFEKRYARDSVAHHRAHWQNLVLPLEGVNEDHIRWFKSEWEKRRARVEDASEEEEYNLLLERIGAYNAKRIMGEEAKRGRGKYVLKMARVVDFNQGSIEKLIQRTTGAPQSPFLRTRGGTP